MSILRAETFINEVRTFSGELDAIFALTPAFFTHSIAVNNQYYPAIPAVEYINQGRVRVYGVPEGLDVEVDLNILKEQDGPFSVDAEALRNTLYNNKSESPPLTFSIPVERDSKKKRKPAPLTKQNTQSDKGVTTSLVRR